MPKDSQKSYFALQAFNVELASIKDGSARLRGGADNSSLALQMKFQRWKDLLQDAYSSNNSTLEESPHASDPVACGLTRAVHDKELTRRFLERLIEAREADVESAQLNTVQEITRYAEESVSSRLYLTLQCMGIRHDAADVVASHADQSSRRTLSCGHGRNSHSRGTLAAVLSVRHVAGFGGRARHGLAGRPG